MKTASSAEFSGFTPRDCKRSRWNKLILKTSISRSPCLSQCVPKRTKRVHLWRALTRVYDVPFWYLPTFVGPCSGVTVWAWKDKLQWRWGGLTGKVLASGKNYCKTTNFPTWINFVNCADSRKIFLRLFLNIARVWAVAQWGSLQHYWASVCPFSP